MYSYKSLGIAAVLALILLVLLGAYFLAIPARAQSVALQVVDDSYTVEQDSVLTVSAPGVLSNDTGLSISTVWNDNPANGSLTMQSDGSFVYTPHSGFVGTDTFAYSAVSGFSGCTPVCATVTITVTAKPTPPPTTTNPPTSGSESSNSSGGRRGGGSVKRPTPVVYTTGGGPGVVLGTSTAPLCGKYLNNYLRMGWNNDKTEVMLLQAFLNGHNNAGLPITGYFGTETYKAVEDFQVKHWQEVLRPWVPHGLPTEKTPTGFVYKTTTRWINMTVCPALNLPMPQLP